MNINNFIFISLGHDCFVKKYLVKKLSDQPTYPWDNLRTFDISKLIQLLDSKCKNMFNKNDFVDEIYAPEGKNSVHKGHKHLYNQKYSFTVKHDFVNDYDNHDEVEIKYNRRIKRFYNDIELKIPVYIRIGITKDEAIKLYDTVKKFNEKSILFCISNDKDIETIDNEHIIFIQYKKKTLWTKDRSRGKHLQIMHDIIMKKLANLYSN